MALGVILSLCYLRVGDDQYGIQNMQGFLYECLALVFVGLLNAVAICSIIPPLLILFLYYNLKLIS